MEHDQLFFVRRARNILILTAIIGLFLYIVFTVFSVANINNKSITPSVVPTEQINQSLDEVTVTPNKQLKSCPVGQTLQCAYGECTCIVGVTTYPENTAGKCDTDEDCPKSASCIDLTKNCTLYKCINHTCTEMRTLLQ